MGTTGFTALIKKRCTVLFILVQNAYLLFSGKNLHNDNVLKIIINSKATQNNATQESKSSFYGLLVLLAAARLHCVNTPRVIDDNLSFRVRFVK